MIEQGDEPLVWAFLRKCQDRNLPVPEVHLEEDGDLGFDWLSVAGSLSISLSETGRVLWAACVKEHLFPVPPYKAHGRFQWPEWSAELDKAFAKFKAWNGDK